MESEVFCRSGFKHSTIIKMRISVTKENFHCVAVYRFFVKKTISEKRVLQKGGPGMILPECLQIGDTIGIIAPASPPNMEKLKQTIPFFKEKIGRASCRERD